MTEWKTYKLGEICNLVAGFAFKSKDFGDFPNKVVKIADIQPPVVNTNELTGVDLSNYDTVKLSKYLVSKGDYMLAMTGATIGKLGRITDDVEAYINQRVLTFRPNESIVDKDYLYYQLCSLNFNKYILNHIDSETAQPNISAGSVGGFEISLPGLEEQRRIAGVLGAIDDKIENNRRINANLESQAQALYKQWFVDFEFPNEEGKPYKSSSGKMVDSELGPIPEGWRVGNIGGYCKIRSGYAFKSSWWTDRGVKIIKIKNITENGVLDMSECSYVDIKHCDKASDFNGHAGDLIIAMTGATLGKVCIIPYHTTDYYINQRVGKFFLGDNPINKLPFIHCILRDENVMSEIINKGQGSAQPNISASDVETIKIVMPSYYIMDKFNLLLQSNYALWLKNMAEVNSLATLRDTLLPKLMNGEIKL